MRLLVAVAAVCLLAATPSASGWVAGIDKQHHADLAVLAAQRLPPEERALVMRNVASFRMGALDPDGITNPDKGIHTFYHAYEVKDGGGGGVYRVQLSLYEAAMAMRRGDAEADVAYQLGVMTHFVLDLSVPFHTGDDDYDNPWHEPYEIAAYDHHGELRIAETRPPEEVGDPKARAIGLAEASARMAEPLIASLDREGHAWTPEAAELTSQAASLGIEATADYLHTAFRWADPARPDPQPTHEAEMPVPKDAEDLGLSLTELAKHHPWLLAAAAFAALAALVALVAWRLALRRDGRRRRAAR